MRLRTLPDQTLVVTSSENWIVLLAAGLAGLAGVGWIVPGTQQQHVRWVVFMGVCALLCLALYERTRFVLDPGAGQLTWQKRTLFRRSGGVLPFRDITSISLEQGFSARGRRTNTHRVVIHTAGGVLPLSRAYTVGLIRFQRAAEAMRRTILLPDPTRELPMVE